MEDHEPQAGEPTWALSPERIAEPARDEADTQLERTLAPWCLDAEEESFFHGWQRYEFRSVLGTGGMGRVFKAWDSTLRRLVAVKVLHGEREELLQRFRTEAQSQARVEHPHVAKVFDVGQHRGRTYLVMQCIEGPNLRELAPKLGLDEKLAIMAQVADGVHAAHRTGIIHRDLKPSNILVEHIEGTGWHAYVTDFGLARAPEHGDVTATGSAVGTPAYMSPEQIRGRSGELTRASDIYSLGVTLFELTTGTFPFQGATPMEMLSSVIKDEPRTLRSVDSRLSPDLETLVATCLDQDPSKRYGSARALAEDLKRYLDGEPILARPPGTLARTGRWLRKHPFASAAALTAGLAASGFAVWLGVQQRFHTRQLYFAQRSNLLATEAEALLRQAWMMREHDLTRELSIVRGRMAAIDAEMKTGGRGAEGPGQFALARIHLALDDRARAQECLERAWRLGYRPREVAEALGEVLSARYYDAIQQKVLPGLGRQLAESRLRELQERYRDEALRLFGAAATRTQDGDSYHEALQAFLHRDFPRAFGLAAEHARRFPWHLDSRWLQARSCYLEAREKAWDRGDIQGAREVIGKGMQVCQEALEEARSSPRMLQERALLHYLLVSVAKLEGTLTAAAYQAAVDASDRVLKVDPGHASALMTRAHTHLAWGEDQLLNRGGDARPALISCIQDARASLRAGLPEVQIPELTGAMMMAHVRIADQQVLAGEDPTPSVEEVRELFRRSAGLDASNPTLRARFPLILHDLATWQFVQGKDPFPTLQEANRIYREGFQYAPESPVLLNNQAYTLSLLIDCRLALGQEAGAELDEALAACGKGLGINPRVWQLQVNAGFLHALKGSFLARRGADPATEWKEAERYLASAEAAAPRHARGLGCQAKLLLWQAMHARASGRMPFAFDRQVLAKAETALAIEPLQLDAAEALAGLSRLPGSPAGLARHGAVIALAKRFPRHPLFR